uniref:Secreted protein n=1 Tax=Rhinolophus ferrumequinum TaxID=59479 RepID=A0A671DYK9_RHIFE
MLFCILFFSARLSFVTFSHHDFAHSCINFPFSVRKQMNNCKVDHRIWGAIRLYNDQGLPEDLQPDLAQLLLLLLTYLWEKNELVLHCMVGSYCYY